MNYQGVVTVIIGHISLLCPEYSVYTDTVSVLNKLWIERSFLDPKVAGAEITESEIFDITVNKEENNGNLCYKRKLSQPQKRRA